MSGPLLVGYALLLGASNTVVGLLAAVSPATQILQIPTVALIERWRVRKAICWWAALGGRAAWFGALAVPWLSPRTRVPGLVTWLLVSAAFATVAGAAWNPWMRDFLPDATRNQVVARRMAIATAVGAMLTLAAGAAIDGLRPALHSAVAPYTLILGVGAIVGLLGLVPLGAIPEPAMTLVARRPWRDILGAPLRDREFRGLIAFLAAWTFAINLSAPFFTVYLLRRLGLPMAAVLALTVLSQLTTAAMFRAWGVVADRFHARTVLRVSCVGLFLSVAGWPVVGALDTPWLVLAGVAAIHVVAGVSAAGVNLYTSTVAMELAPRGEAASYLASNALVSGVAAALAPVIAGFAADGLEPSGFRRRSCGPPRSARATVWPSSTRPPWPRLSVHRNARRRALRRSPHPGGGRTGAGRSPGGHGGTGRRSAGTDAAAVAGALDRPRRPRRGRPADLVGELAPA